MFTIQEDCLRKVTPISKSKSIERLTYFCITSCFNRADVLCKSVHVCMTTKITNSNITNTTR